MHATSWLLVDLPTTTSDCVTTVHQLVTRDSARRGAWWGVNSRLCRQEGGGQSRPCRSKGADRLKAVVHPRDRDQRFYL
jgi:hypothetical protein